MRTIPERLTKKGKECLMIDLGETGNNIFYEQAD